MKRKYRIKGKKTRDSEVYGGVCIVYKVQVKFLFWWITIKSFKDYIDDDFSKREAEELLEKLKEK